MGTVKTRLIFLRGSSLMHYVACELKDGQKQLARASRAGRERVSSVQTTVYSSYKRCQISHFIRNLMCGKETGTFQG